MFYASNIRYWQNQSIHNHSLNMEDQAKAGEELKETFLELGFKAKEANEKLRIFLMGLPKEDMIDRIRQLNLSDKSLNFLCEGIALEQEDYEICSAVEAIKKERVLKKSISAV